MSIDVAGFEQAAQSHPIINSSEFVAYSGARQITSTADGRIWFVTGQPYPVSFPVMAQTDKIATVINVRASSETTEAPPPTPPAPPYDAGEQGLLAGAGITNYYHITVTRTMNQSQFDAAATQAADTLYAASATAPALVHCSSGDRASSVFAVMLMKYYGFGNNLAVAYCVSCLLLANESMISLVLGYTPQSG
ncbi:MAG: hypothetical protein JO164_00645 [Candidatus Eremiobacteraeota bacterium]|nr:hypothetical protein [Candidatus Eremiobacteraeota bacterium]